MKITRYKAQWFPPINRTPSTLSSLLELSIDASTTFRIAWIDEIVSIDNVEGYGRTNEEDVGNQNHPAKDHLPSMSLQVFQRIHTDDKANQGAGEMSRVRGSIVFPLDVAPVNGHHHVDSDESDQSGQTEPIELHFRPILQWKKTTTKREGNERIKVHLQWTQQLTMTTLAKWAASSA